MLQLIGAVNNNRLYLYIITFTYLEIHSTLIYFLNIVDDLILKNIISAKTIHVILKIS